MCFNFLNFFSICYKNKKVIETFCATCTGAGYPSIVNDLIDDIFLYVPSKK